MSSSQVPITSNNPPSSSNDKHEVTSPSTRAKKITAEAKKALKDYFEQAGFMMNQILPRKNAPAVSLSPFPAPPPTGMLHKKKQK